MLFTALVWVYTTFLCTIFGLATAAALGKAFRVDDPIPPAPLLLAVGLATLGAFAGLLSLALPMRWGAHAAVLTCAIAIVTAQRPLYTRLCHRFARRITALHPLVKVSAALVLLWLLEGATTTPTAYDTGLYHAQAIRWIEEYGAVPGLGNLHFRFAFDSSWFVLQALLDFAFITGAPIYALGSWLLGLAAVFALLGADAMLRKAQLPTDLLRVLLLVLLFPLLGTWISSPSPDPVVGALTWIVLASAWEAARRGELLHPNSTTLSLLVLCVFLVTVKMSAAPIALLALAIGIAFARRDRRPGAAALLVLPAFALPYVLRQLVISGYPNFPLTALDPFDFEWKMPRRSGSDVAALVVSWAHAPGLMPREAYATLPFGWLRLWRGGIRPITALLFLALLAGLAARALAMRRAGERDESVQHAIVIATALSGVAYWSFLAPDPRFGVGFYPIAALLLWLPWITRAASHLGPPAVAVLAIGALGGQLLVISDVSPRPESIVGRLIRPARCPTVPMTTIEMGNFSIAAPEQGDQCWYDPFPCAPIAIPNPNLFRRRPDWADGFRIEATAP